jgi:hypothetical protein
MRGLAEIIPLRTAQCREAVDAVAQIAAGEGDIEPKAAHHVSVCLRCQAEVAAYRRILRTMRAMRHDLVDPPPGSLAELLRSLSEGGAPGDGSGTSWAVMAACVGGLTAAGAAGVLVWFSRRRPGGLAPAI